MVTKRLQWIWTMLIVIVLCSFTIPRKFPDFEIPSFDGRLYSQKDLKGKTTIIAMYHLGCYPAMILMNDLDSLQRTIDTNQIQILAILENTNDHLNQFYSDSSNNWSILRKMFKTPKVSYPLLPECESENITQTDSSLLIGQHCRSLAKKIHTKSSPTIVVVNPLGKMISIDRGYIAIDTFPNRMKWLKEIIDQ